MWRCGLSSSRSCWLVWFDAPVPGASLLSTLSTGPLCLMWQLHTRLHLLPSCSELAYAQDLQSREVWGMENMALLETVSKESHTITCRTKTQTYTSTTHTHKQQKHTYICSGVHVSHKMTAPSCVYVKA